jgi:hypothetical protein
LTGLIEIVCAAAPAVAGTWALTVIFASCLGERSTTRTMPPGSNVP